MAQTSEGSLMAEIQRLIAAPNEEYRKKPPNPFKRGNKNNHDTCDACSEAGNLICCDYCAASFHLACCDPPIEEKDIPTGLWNCKSCTMKEKYAEKAPEIEEEMKIEETSPFNELVRAASLLNPHQFELPIDYVEQFPFPGSERAGTKIKNGRRVKSKRLIELDSHGCVPLPAKLCFTCNRSCKKAPLISCDYCTLYFHQDCLDPPMTHLPAGLWMCPNHFQNFVDWNLVTSLSATERLKYWDRFGKNPIDHEVVKLEFFRKVHMAHPPFRTKQKPLPLDSIDIPEIVRYHYENPPDLLPSLRQVLRVDTLKKRGTVAIETAARTSHQFTGIDEQLEEMNSARKKLKTIFTDLEDVHGLLEEEDDDEEEIPEPREESPKKPKKKPEIPEIKIEPPTEVKIEPEVVEEEDSKKQLLLDVQRQAIEEQLANLDLETIKLLAFQRFQQIVNENPNCIQKFQEESTAAKTVTEIALWDIARFPIPEVSAENAQNEKIISSRFPDRPFHIRADAEKASSLALSLELPLHRSKVPARAVLTFVNDYLDGRTWFTVAPSLNSTTFMRYRSFNIGIGADNHLDLTRFGLCAFTSPKHAVIFYDDVTRQFELMNYSEFGCEVNGQIYSCDFSERVAEEVEVTTSPLKEKRVAIQSKIKNMLDAKKKIREGIDKTETIGGDDIVMAAEEPTVCNCKGRHPMLAGWEGTALLQHGNLIRFGCLSFVFSVVDNHIEIEP